MFKPWICPGHYKPRVLTYGNVSYQIVDLINQLILLSVLNSVLRLNLSRSYLAGLFFTCQCHACTAEDEERGAHMQILILLIS